MTDSSKRLVVLKISLAAILGVTTVAWVLDGNSSARSLSRVALGVGGVVGLATGATTGVRTLEAATERFRWAMAPIGVLCLFVLITIDSGAVTFGCTGGLAVGYLASLPVDLS